MTFRMLYILNQNAELNPRDVKWEKEGEKQKKVVEGEGRLFLCADDVIVHAEKPRESIR